MSNPKSESHASASSPHVTTTLATSPAVIHPRERIAQNFLLLWVDANVDEYKQDSQNTLTQLRSVVNNVIIFTDQDQCLHFLNETNNEKAFIIVSGSLGQHLVPEIHPLQQLDAIYIFCADRSRHEEWAKNCPKIKGIHTAIQPICEALRVAAKQCNQDSVALSFVSVGEDTTSAELNQLEPTFMYTQIFKEILLEMEHDDKSMDDLVAHCRTLHHHNHAELTIISEFQTTYRAKAAIWWYTRECFAYQMLNRALRTLEGDTIIKMGFFMRDLHLQIQDLYRQQINDCPEKCFIVYRGQGLLNTDFEKLKTTEGGLMSFNSFLSTSRDQSVSLGFAKNALTKTNTVGILFKLFIDTCVSSTPFALIQDASYFKNEAEVLFSMHTVFRIQNIKKLDDSGLLHQVDLLLTADDDQQLRRLTERMREEIAGTKGWSRLGSLLIRISQFDKAEELYKILLEQKYDEDERASHYIQLGYIKKTIGDHEKALYYYNKGLEIQQKILTPTHLTLSITYNNIGALYYCMHEYSKARTYYQKDLEISEKNLSSDHSHMAIIYNNIGLVCDKMGEHSKALMYFQKVLAIEEKIFPSNHPTLATTHSNIGGVYYSMKDYSKALLFYKKDLEICEKTLSPNNDLLATSYANIGSSYLGMKDYSKALTYLEHALEIYQHIFPPGHHHIQNTQDDITIAKEKMKSDTS